MVCFCFGGSAFQPVPKEDPDLIENPTSTEGAILPINESFQEPEVSYMECWGRRWSNLTQYVKATVKQAVGWVVDKEGLLRLTKRYSDVAFNSIVFLASTVYCFSAVSDHFWGGFLPPEVVSWSYFAVEVCWVAIIPFSAHLLIKTMGDVWTGVRVRSPLVVADATINTALIATSLFLGGSGVGAAIFRLNKQMKTVEKIYTITRPTGVISLWTQFSMNILHVGRDWWTGRKLKAGLSSKELQTLHSVLRKHPVNLRGKDVYSRRGAFIAALLRESMDKDTWEAFSKDLELVTVEDFEKLKIMLGVCQENIYLQIKTQAGANVVLQVFGSISLSISDWYPGTWIQASIGELFSVIYFTKLIYEKWRQAKERNANRRAAQAPVEALSSS